MLNASLNKLIISAIFCLFHVEIIKSQCTLACVCDDYVVTETSGCHCQASNNHCDCKGIRMCSKWGYCGYCTDLNSCPASVCSQSDYYVSGKTCVPCDDAHCLKCTGPGACTLCSSPYVVTSGICDCPSKYYDDGSTCRSCDANCLTCTGPGACSVCSSTFSVSGGVCVCSSGYYKSGSSCLACDKNCLTCTGPGACSLCRSTYVLSGGMCVCPSGTYNAGSSCVACAANCLHCTGPSACSMCSSTYLLSGGMCVCPSGTYNSGTSCVACNSNCLTCTSATFCNSCRNTFYYYSGQCLTACPSSPPLYGNQLTSTCEASCPYSNQYYDSNRICQDCSSNCLTCSFTATNCTSCSSGLFLSTLTNTCVKLCPLGTYGVASCNKCLPDCEDYYFQNDEDRLCYTTCPDPLFGNVQTKKCVSICPAGMYQDATTNRCEFCDFNCATCLGSSANCISCKYSWLLGSACSNPSYTSFSDYKSLNTNPMSNSFITSIGGFTINGAATINYGLVCSTYCAVGGPANFGRDSSIEKNYSSLLPHFRARVTFYFMKIDNWNGESVQVLADGISIPTNLTFNSSMDSSVMKLCGSASYTEAIRPVDVIFSHNSKILNLKITTNLSSPVSVASWGIFQFSMSIDKCNVYCASCLGPNPSDCLSCIKGWFLQTIPGPSTCASLCPDGFYADATTSTCQVCNSQCMKCSAGTSNDCLVCFKGRYLLVRGGASTCVSSCPNDTFVDSSNNCVQCDPTCKTCTGALPSNCLNCNLPRYFIGGECVYQCPGFFFGDNSTVACIQNCPETTFGYEVSKICCPCHNCKSCNGFAANQCISCIEGQVLQDNTCVSTCSPDHFLNQANSSCDVCVSGCSECSSLYTCSQCSTNLYKLLPQNESCVVCDQPGQFKNTTSQICSNCVSQCSICATMTTCFVCMDNYFLASPSSCILQKQLFAQLIPTLNPQIYQIKFSQNWPDFFKNISSYTIINIPSLLSTDYNYNLSYESSCTISINFTFNREVKNSTIMNLLINYPDYPNDEYLIHDKNLTANMLQFCPLPTTYLSSYLFIFFSGFYITKKAVQTCVSIDYITPILKVTIDPTILQLRFSLNYGLLFKQYYQRSTIQISNLNSSLYGYTITPSSASNDIYYINLNFSVSISNKPTLTLDLSPPTFILFNSSNTLQLTSNQVECTLNDYYVMNSATKAMVDTAKTGSSSINSAAGNAFTANNFMMGSSFGVKSLVSMDTIRFLRYFAIDYPPNVVAMFQAQMPMSDLIPNVQIEEDPADGSLPDVFNNYNFSTYCFNNNGNSVVETFAYVLFGVGVLILLKLSKKTKNHYFRVLTLILRLVFVWNYAIGYFLSQFMNFTLSTFLAFRYPSNVTTKGKANYYFAFFTLFIMIAVFIFSGYIIWKLRPMLMTKSLEEKQHEVKNKKTNKVSPVINPCSSDSNRILKGIDMSSTAVFPDIQSPYLSSAQENGTETIKLKTTKKKIVAFDQSMNIKRVETSGGGILSSTFDENTRITKVDTFGKIETDMIESSKPITKLPKTILLSSHFSNLEEGKSTIISRLDSGKSKEVYFNNSKEMESSYFGEVKTLASKKSMIPMTNSLPWLIRFKTGLQSLLSIKKKENENDWREYDQIELERNLEVLNRSFFPLHKDFKQTLIFQSFFLIFDLFRQSLFSMMVTVTFDTPFLGLIFINIINFCYIGSYIYIKPFKDKVDLIQNFLNELCLLISSMCAIFMAGMEKFNSVDMSKKMMLGWIMVFVNTFLILMFLLRIGIKLLQIFSLLLKLVIITIVKNFQKKDKKNRFENKEQKKDDDAAFQQLLDILNFLR